MAISIETVLKQIVKLSESDKGNLVSIQDLMCELDYKYYESRFNI